MCILLDDSYKLTEQHIQRAKALVNMIKTKEIDLREIVISTGVCSDTIQCMIDNNCTDQGVPARSIISLSNCYYKRHMLASEDSQSDFLFGQLYAILLKMDIENGSEHIRSISHNDFIYEPKCYFRSMCGMIFDRRLFSEDVYYNYDADITRIINKLDSINIPDRPLNIEFFNSFQLKTEELSTSFEPVYI